MTHLNAQQFVDAIDGTLASAHERHLETCEACRAQVANLRSLETEVRDVDAPEPSPLFWDHLSERIRRATSVEPIPAPHWWRSAWSPALTGALAIATLAIVLSVRGGPAPATINEMAQTIGSSEAAALTEDDSLSFVARVAARADSEDLHQAARPTPDGVDAALNQLNDEQRAALVRLLRAKIGSGE